MMLEQKGHVVSSSRKKKSSSFVALMVDAP